MNKRISIVIPMYNAESTIDSCLKAIEQQSIKPFETIVVDDRSKDSSVKIAKKHRCTVITLPKNSGPAHARNVGARKARGNILFFMDSDVILESDAVARTIAHFKKKKGIPVVGIYSITPGKDTFFNWFMAIQKYSNWTKAKQQDYSSFQTRLGAIPKELFFSCGGFNSSYRGADTEDYEFGYRLIRKSRVILDKRIQGRHHFPSFQSVFRNYMKRSGQWLRLFLKRKQFDNVTTTASLGMAMASSFLGIILLLNSLILFVLTLQEAGYFILAVSLLFLAIFFFENSHFYLLCLKKNGFLFMTGSIIISYALSVAVGIGVIRSALTLPFSR